MAARRVPSRAGDTLTGPRRRSDYNAAERAFSLILHERLQEVLQGKRNHLELLRKYPNEPGRLGVIPTPAHVPKDQLRLPVVERLSWEALDFVRADSVGGPISQRQAPDGSILEQQTFPTKYPHILIERTDRYAPDGASPVETTWCLRRVQNQRRQVRINRVLDAANLALEFLRAFH